MLSYHYYLMKNTLFLLHIFHLQIMSDFFFYHNSTKNYNCPQLLL